MSRHQLLLWLSLCSAGLAACTSGTGAPAAPDAGVADAGVAPEPPGPALGPALTGTCRAGGWCWENPLPQGYRLRSFWTQTEGDAWAGGDNGLLMHWDGTAWSETPSRATRAITSLWGSGAREVWALSETEKVLRWDGTAWSEVAACPGSEPLALWGSRASAVWFACSDGSLRLWDGAAIQILNTSVRRYGATIRGSGPDDVWFILTLASNAGWELRHWDGSAVTRWVDHGLAAPTSTDTILDVWPIGPGDAWAVGGGSGGITRWDGTAFKAVPHPAGSYGSVWASGPADVWFTSHDGTILRWDGAAFRSLRSPTALGDAIWGSGPSDVWMSTRSGLGVVHWDGSKLTLLDRATGPSYLGITGSSKRDVWFYGDQGLLRHWNGAALSAIDVSVTQADVTAIFGAGPEDVWAALYDPIGTGPGRMLRRLGKTWQEVRHPYPGKIFRLHGTGPSDIWAVGDMGTIERWDGVAWASIPSGTPSALFGVWASGPRDAWACGMSGTLLRWDGVSWSPVANPGDQMAAVWGSGPSDVWFATARGMLRWNGTTLERVTLPAPIALTDVWGTGPSDVWGVGSGAVLHWDGATWQTRPILPPGKSSSLGGLWGTSPTDVWALGDYDTEVGVFHWDGTSWQHPTAVLRNLTALWGSGKDLWLGGARGALLHRRM